MALPFLFQAYSELLAMIDNYHLSRKNARYDLNSEIDLLWGGFPESIFVRLILCFDEEVVWSNLDHYTLNPPVDIGSPSRPK